MVVPSLYNPKFLLHLLKWHAFGLRHHELHPDELQRHHAAEEEEDVSCRAGRRIFGRDEQRHKRGEEGGQQRRKDPMREAAQGLAFSTVAVRENFRDEYPDHSTLPDRVRCDKGEDASRHDFEMSREERPCAESERGDIAEGADRQQLLAAEAVNQPETDEGEDEVGDSNADRLQQETVEEKVLNTCQCLV